MQRQEGAEMSAADYIQRGVHHHNEDQWDDAIVAFTQAIALNPDCAEAYYRRACAYHSLHTMDKNGWRPELIPEEQYLPEIDDFCRAKELAPDNPNCFCDLALTYSRIEGKAHLAILNYHKSAEIGAPVYAKWFSVYITRLDCDQILAELKNLSPREELKLLTEALDPDTVLGARLYREKANELLDRVTYLKDRDSHEIQKTIKLLYHFKNQESIFSTLPKNMLLFTAAKTADVLPEDEAMKIARENFRPFDFEQASRSPGK